VVFDGFFVVRNWRERELERELEREREREREWKESTGEAFSPVISVRSSTPDSPGELCSLNPLERHSVDHCRKELFEKVAVLALQLR
jgi:hypothetical protein